MILLNVIGINFEFHTLSKQIPVIIKKKKKKAIQGHQSKWKDWFLSSEIQISWSRLV